EKIHEPHTHLLTRVKRNVNQLLLQNRNPLPRLPFLVRELAGGRLQEQLIILQRLYLAMQAVVRSCPKKVSCWCFRRKFRSRRKRLQHKLRLVRLRRRKRDPAPCVSIILARFHRLLQQIQCFRVLTLPNQNLPLRRFQIGVIRSRRQQFCVDSVCLLCFSGLYIAVRQHPRNASVLRFQLMQLLQRLHRLVRLPLSSQQRRILRIQRRITRVAKQRRVNQRLRLRIFLLPHQQMGQPRNRLRRLRILLQYAAIRLLSNIRIPGSLGNLRRQQRVRRSLGRNPQRIDQRLLRQAWIGVAVHPRQRPQSLRLRRWIRRVRFQCRRRLQLLARVRVSLLRQNQPKRQPRLKLLRVRHNRFPVELLRSRRPPLRIVAVSAVEQRPRVFRMRGNVDVQHPPRLVVFLRRNLRLNPIQRTRLRGNLLTIIQACPRRQRSRLPQEHRTKT